MGRRAYPYLVKAKKIKPPTSYVYHKVRKGQTLGHMARKYGTSVSAIKRANGLRSNLIRAGKSYRIPRRGGVKPAPKAVMIPPRKIPPTLAGGKRVSIKEKMAERPPVQTNLPAGNVQKPPPTDKPVVKSSPPKVKKKARPKRKMVRYKVRSGDNLWTIARRHNVHVKDIKRWNGLSSNNLKPGQVLKIYKKT